MFLVAITGGIASGKSTVTNVFRENGVPVIDADLIAKEIVEPGKPAWHQIKESFGDDIIDDSREINRDALGKLIFDNVELRRKLNDITHPIIHRTIFFQVFRHFMSGANYVVLDLPLLFETGILMDFIYKIITVSCNQETQVKRLMARSTLNEVDARKRISSQMPLEKKCEKSHFVIDNSESIEITRTEAKGILDMLNQSKHHWRIRSYMLIAVVSVLILIYWLNIIFEFLPSIGS